MLNTFLFCIHFQEWELYSVNEKINLRMPAKPEVDIKKGISTYSVVNKNESFIVKLNEFNANFSFDENMMETFENTLRSKTYEEVSKRKHTKIISEQKGVYQNKYKFIEYEVRDLENLRNETYRFFIMPNLSLVLRYHSSFNYKNSNKDVFFNSLNIN